MASADWSEDEIIAAVKAYLWMLDQEQAGRDYVKAHVRRDLLAGPLSGRTDGSVEMRMCNISTVLKSLGRPFIDGYKPRDHVGQNVATVIRVAIKSMTGEPAFSLSLNRP